MPYSILKPHNKYWLVSFVILVAFFTGIACQLGKISQHPSDWLIRRISAEPDSLNPLVATDAYESVINSDIYESLLDRNPDSLEMEPELATTWEISADGLVYTFKLREGVKFHDGHPLTVGDIKYAYDRIMDPKVNAPHLRNYYQIGRASGRERG